MMASKTEYRCVLAGLLICGGLVAIVLAPANVPEMPYTTAAQYDVRLLPIGISSAELIRRCGTPSLISDYRRQPGHQQWSYDPPKAAYFDAAARGDPAPPTPDEVYVDYGVVSSWQHHSGIESHPYPQSKDNGMTKQPSLAL